MNIGKASINILLVFAMLITMIASVGVRESVPIVYAAPSVNIGDYIQFGKYNNEPILWRVIHKDANGDPVLFADRILTLKAFDTAGSYHTGDSNCSNYPDSRKCFGSNYYPDSNIRQWLNSSSPNSGANTIDWIQNDPTPANIWGGYNPYNTEKGFLADGNFTSTERGLIKPLTHKVLLAGADQAKKDGGSVNHTMNSLLSTVLQNYDTTAYFKNVKDSVLLLSVKQLKEWVFDNSTTLGSNYHIAKPTAQAVIQSTYTSTSLNSSNNWSYLLNTPHAQLSSYFVRFVASEGNVASSSSAYDGLSGIRPALLFNLSSAIFRSGGTGISSNPHVVSGALPPDTLAPSALSGLSASNISANALTLAWTASTDNVGVAGYEVYRDGNLLTTVSGSTTNYRVSGLTPLTSYAFSVRARDATGNKSSAGSITVRTLVPPDTNPPSRPTNIEATYNEGGVVYIGWDPSQDDIAVEGYRLFLDDSEFNVTESTSYLFDNLNEGERYTLYIQAFDAAGNRSKSSELVYFRVSTTAVSSPPPAPSNLTLNTTTESSITISWQQSGSTDIISGYVIYLDGNRYIDTQSTNRSFRITGLRPYRNYRIQVTAYTPSSIESELSESKTYRTADLTAPTIPIALRVTQQAPLTALRLTWSPSSDNAAIAGYNVFLNNKLLTTRTVSQLGNTAALTRFDINNLSHGSHRLQVQAFDAAGNKSKLSQAINTPRTILVTGGKLYVNGKVINLGSGFSPTVIGGQMMVPYKPFFTALDFTSTWFTSNKMVEAHSRDKKYAFKLTQGVRSMQVKSTDRTSFVTLQSAPMSRNGQLMIPISPIAKELGYSFTVR